jgi:hypothetical protein
MKFPSQSFNEPTSDTGSRQRGVNVHSNVHSNFDQSKMNNLQRQLDEFKEVKVRAQELDQLYDGLRQNWQTHKKLRDVRDALVKKQRVERNAAHLRMLFGYSNDIPFSWETRLSKFRPRDFDTKSIRWVDPPHLDRSNIRSLRLPQFPPHINHHRSEEYTWVAA